jgi:hypothetical protein
MLIFLFLTEILNYKLVFDGITREPNLRSDFRAIFYAGKISLKFISNFRISFSGRHVNNVAHKLA